MEIHEHENRYFKIKCIVSSVDVSSHTRRAITTYLPYSLEEMRIIVSLIVGLKSLIDFPFPSR